MQDGEDTTVITLRTSQYRVPLIPQRNTLVRDFTVFLRVHVLCLFVLFLQTFCLSECIWQWHQWHPCIAYIATKYIVIALWLCQTLAHTVVLFIFDTPNGQQLNRMISIYPQQHPCLGVLPIHCLSHSHGKVNSLMIYPSSMPLLRQFPIANFNSAPPSSAETA